MKSYDRTLKSQLERLTPFFSDVLLDNIESKTLDAYKTKRTANERYVDVSDLLRDRDKTIAAAFANPRRSQMVLQLGIVQSLDLLASDELAQFGESTQREARELADIN